MTFDEFLNELLDEDGENQAVRYFLMLYGGASGVTIAQMKSHMTASGYKNFWPAWARGYDHTSTEHLTKAGAQNWLRFLFFLEDPYNFDAALEELK